MSGVFKRMDDEPSGKASPDKLWSHDFSKAQEKSRTVEQALQQRPQPGAQGSVQRSEYARWSARVRGQLKQLEQDYIALQRSLDSLSRDSQKYNLTRKEITKREDMLHRAKTLLTEMQESFKNQAAARGPGSPSPGSPTVGASPWASGSSSNSAVKSAELASMNDNALLQRQEQVLRQQDDNLADLEGTVQNLKHIGNVINQEIGLHNRMLDAANDELDETNDRLSRTQRLMGRVLQKTKTCKLKLAIAGLAAALIIILVFVLKH